MLPLLIIHAALIAQGPRCPSAGDTAALTLADVERRPVADSANAPPWYNDLLRQAGIGGPVRVTFTVDTTGRVEPATIRIVRSPNPGFDVAVKRAVAKWRYAPASLCRRAVRVRMNHEFAFQLSSIPRDTLRWSQLFELEAGPGATLNADTLPDGTPRTTVGWRAPTIVVAPVPWDAAALDSAEEAVLAFLVEHMSPAPSGGAQVLCLLGKGGRGSDPDSGRLVRLTRPGIAVLPFRRCPPTFASPIYQPGDPPRPPGEDPFVLDVRGRSPVSSTRVVVNVDLAQGTGGHHYRCGVERRETGWRVRCVITSSWVS
ncbi:MAG TPA: energy transducer TonB [Gemmatimonadales bacterium]|jgi:TonB family protein|nr:energy transducer TonB [Gemmatimonadales bacterium]